MRAVRWHADENGVRLQLDDVPAPELRQGWVLIKVAWSGICGSDLHEYTHGPKNVPLTPHPVTHETVPTGVGHEFAGTVAGLGDGVDDLEIDEKVVVFPSIMDHTCYYCNVEPPIFGLCQSRGFIGFSGFGGGMQEYTCVERMAVHKIPEHVPLDVAALTEPLAVAWHAVSLSNARPEGAALVFGAGPIGVAVVMCLKARGVSKIYVSEPSPGRSSQAKLAGATTVWNPVTDDVVQAVRDVTDGRGAHVIFECAGVESALQGAFEAADGRATIVGIAKYARPVTLWPNSFNKKGVSYVQSNIYGREEFQDVIDAIASDKIQSPEHMITGRITLERAIENGFEELLNTTDKHCKILVKSNVG